MHTLWVKLCKAASIASQHTDESFMYLTIHSGSGWDEDGIICENVMQAVPHCRDHTTCQQACAITHLHSLMLFLDNYSKHLVLHEELLAAELSCTGLGHFGAECILTLQPGSERAFIKHITDQDVAADGDVCLLRQVAGPLVNDLKALF